MSNSRQNILNKLRAAQQPYPNLESAPPQERLPMVPLTDTSPAALLARFVAAAQALKCHVVQPVDDAAAFDVLLQIIGAEKRISMWDAAHIPLKGLPEMLTKHGIDIAPQDDPHVQVGITGADAAIAATGSLVLMSGAGKSRAVSLLPFVHIAIIRQSQLLPSMEAWMVQQKASGLDALRQISNTVLITGASKTADIAMELVNGAHGPAELHILILP